MLILVAALASTASTPSDLTATRLRQCLSSEGGSSTGGQSTCYDISRSAYQGRMILATLALERLLTGDALAAVRAEQTAWLAYRAAHRKAMSTMLSTRQGSMYAPMEAADEMEMARDRALRLEAQVRIMEIDQ